MSEIGLIEPPNSKEAEMMVLGCMLTSINGLNVNCETLSRDDFYYDENIPIFDALKHVYNNDTSADVHIICEQLKRRGKLESSGGAPYLTTLAQFAGTSAHVEEYCQIVKDKSILRQVIQKAQKIQNKALENPENPIFVIEEAEHTFKSIGYSRGRAIPIVATDERLDRENEFLKLSRGKSYLGLKVRTITEFNDCFKGLRGLNILAAAPNVGKTALTVQIALEVLMEQDDVCLVYVSLEMSEEQIFRRMIVNLCGLDFNTYVFGGSNQATFSKSEDDVFFTEEEYEKIERAKQVLSSLKDRLQIVDLTARSKLDAPTVVKYIDEIKRRTKCARAIVIIDYLQVWPIDPLVKITTDIETDKWRIGEMKKIRDSLDKDREPIIVISEARKPGQNGNNWGGSLADVMGSARGTYTPDVVMLISQLQPKDMVTLWSAKHIPDIPLCKHYGSDENENKGKSIISFLANHGMSICNLKISKCRDGMQRFETLLTFHFRKNFFSYVDWEEISELAEDISAKG